MADVSRNVPPRVLVDKNQNYHDDDNPLPTGAYGETDDANATPVRLKVDPATGALVVVGAGAEPAATTMKIADATNPLTQLAEVDADGDLHVEDTQAASKLDSLIAEVDGLEEALGTTGDADTLTTVVGLLKWLKANLLQEVTFTSEDFATQTTLAEIKTRVDLLLDETTFNNEDFATQTTLAALKSRADNLLDETTFSAEDFAQEATLSDVKRALTDYETRLDYDARTDGNPVYVGKASNGTATSAASWTIQKMTYDASNRLTHAQVLSGVAWDNRASLGW